MANTALPCGRCCCGSRLASSACLKTIASPTYALMPTTRRWSSRGTSSTPAPSNTPSSLLGRPSSSAPTAIPLPTLVGGTHHVVVSVTPCVTGGTLRISQWNATPLAINNQFLNITVRTRSTYNGQSVDSDDFSMLAPNRPCGLRGLTPAARAGDGHVYVAAVCSTPCRTHCWRRHRLVAARWPGDGDHRRHPPEAAAAAVDKDSVYGCQHHHAAIVTSVVELLHSFAPTTITLLPAFSYGGPP